MQGIELPHRHCLLLVHLRCNGSPELHPFRLIGSRIMGFPQDSLANFEPLLALLLPILCQFAHASPITITTAVRALKLFLLIIFLLFLYLLFLDALLYPEHKLNAVAWFIVDGMGMLLGFLRDIFGWLSN